MIINRSDNHKIRQLDVVLTQVLYRQATTNSRRE